MHELSFEYQRSSTYRGPAVIRVSFAVPVSSYATMYLPAALLLMFRPCGRPAFEPSNILVQP